MKYHFRIFCLILGIVGIIDNVLCITEEAIEKIVERKMEKIIQSMTERLLFWRKKSTLKTLIQNLKKKYSTQKMDAEKEREEALIQHNVSKDDNDNGIQSKRPVAI